MQCDKLICLIAAGMACAVSNNAAAMTDVELTQITEQRLPGDRTGACFAVAVIDKSVSKALVCADPSDKNRISPASAFEIGSVSKTMLAALWAEQIGQGKASLDDPIAKYLPAGMQVPSFENQPILLKHLVTHTSGLPVVPNFGADLDPSNPYALIDAASVLATLNQSTLNRAPGSQFEYSNFAMMLATLMLTRQTNTDFETLLKTRLFGPLGMASSYVRARPAGVSAAQGHLPNTQATPAWTFQTDLAGVGGVRATLDDMARFVQAQLGKPPSAVLAALRASQQAIKTPAIDTIGMNWMLSAPFQQTIVSHEGGTGGFSAYVAFNTEASRGVVVLSDTALMSLGGLGSLGNHLIDDRLPLGQPRIQQTPNTALLNQLVGTYQLSPQLQMALTRKGQRLFIQANGQDKLEMGFDSAGDFYPLVFDALLQVRKQTNGRWQLVWFQGGGAQPLTRLKR